MTSQNKFEDTYGQQLDEKVQKPTMDPPPSQGKSHQNHFDKKELPTSSTLFTIARWIMFALIATTLLVVGGIFSMIVLGIMAISMIIRFLLPSSGSTGSLTKRF